MTAALAADVDTLRRRARQACLASAVGGVPVRLLEHMVAASVTEPPLPAWGPGEYYLDNWPAAAIALGHDVPALPTKYEWFADLDERRHKRRLARQVVDRHTRTLVDAGLLEVVAKRYGPRPAAYRLRVAAILAGELR